MAPPMRIVALDALKSLVFHRFGMKKGLPDFSENPQGGVRGIRNIWTMTPYSRFWLFSNGLDYL